MADTGFDHTDFLQCCKFAEVSRVGGGGGGHVWRAMHERGAVGDDRWRKDV